MSIKKSSLEQKWYYRMAKVFFWVVPIILVILFLLNKKAVVCDVSAVNISDILKDSILYIIILLILYFLVLTIVWRIFLYIIFGGLEDDTRNKDVEKVQSVNSTDPKTNNKTQWLPYIIAIIIFSIIFLSMMGYITLPKIDLDSSGDSNAKTTPKKHTCWTTSAQMGTPCHSAKNGVGVTGVITYDYCECPTDTTYAGMDNITAGGPYKICTCK